MNRSRLLTLVLTLLITAFAAQPAGAAYGDLDATFGAGGKVRIPGEMADTPIAVRVQPDGRILFAMNPLSKASGWLFRMKQNGAIDTGFAKGGRFELPDGQKIDDVELLADGRIAVLGNSDADSGIRRTRLAVLKPNGWPDISFAGAGDLTVGINSSGIRAHSIAVQGGSKILLAGSLEGSTTTTSVMRLKEDGTLDASFGNAGTASAPGAAMGSVTDSATSTSAIAVNGAGELLLGIDRIGEPSVRKSGVAKFTADGVAVADFGSAGVAPLMPGGGYLDGVTSIAAANNGNIIAIGRVYFGGRGGMGHAVNYLFPNGSTVLAASGNSSEVVGLGKAGFALSAPDGFSSLKESFAPNILFHKKSAKLVLENCDSWGPIGAYSDGRLVSISHDEGCDGPRTPGLSVIRMLGPKGGKTAPLVRIRSEVRSLYERGAPNSIWLRAVSGIAAPAQELSKVEVAIQKIDSKLLSKGRCRWVSSHGTRSLTRRATGGVCKSPHFMRAYGLEKWNLKLRRPLPIGRYRMYVRGTTEAGVSGPLNMDPYNYKTFTVVKSH